MPCCTFARRAGCLQCCSKTPAWCYCTRHAAVTGNGLCFSHTLGGMQADSWPLCLISCCCCCCCLQENDLLHKQNELLRSSEAAYQKEAQLVRRAALYLRSSKGSIMIQQQAHVLAAPTAARQCCIMLMSELAQHCMLTRQGPRCYTFISLMQLCCHQSTTHTASLHNTGFFKLASGFMPQTTFSLLAACSPCSCVRS
jgi:hypothetical protein